ncbi:helix-turn-helix domain-containing transcriptional regulator [Achromobacter aegrifaciens]
MSEPLTFDIPKEFSRWDAADTLKTDKDAALYYEACLAEDPGDGRLVRAALGDIARARSKNRRPR